MSTEELENYFETDVEQVSYDHYIVGAYPRQFELEMPDELWWAVTYRDGSVGTRTGRTGYGLSRLKDRL